MIARDIKPAVMSCLFKGKAVVLYGARRVGKTTLIRDMQSHFADDSLFLNCDEPDVRERLTGATSRSMKDFIGNRKIVFLDEAQRISDIGITLKLLVDTYPELQVVATGSSSLDLSNRIMESLTGRAYEFLLLPFSLHELADRSDPFVPDRILENRMIWGMYPEVTQKPEEAEALIKNIITGYLYKDVLQYRDVRRPEVLERLLMLLALQTGSEVSFHELAGELDTSKETVGHYIRLLEQAFVIFRLTPYSRNLRNELKKKPKIYFYDTGIRNGLINNFNSCMMRNDSGALWENLMVCERLKYNGVSGRSPNRYFWRSGSQGEVDYLEEEGGKLYGWEFKWGKARKKVPRLFLDTYPESSVEVVNREHYHRFIGLE